jgi:hypothetical protein
MNADAHYRKCCELIKNKFRKYTMKKLTITLCGTIFLTQGCATAPKNAYKTEQASTITVRAAIKGYEDAVKAGYVSPDTIDLANKALATYKNAADILLFAGEELQKAQAAGNPEGIEKAKQILIVAQKTFAASEADFLALIGRYATPVKN